jgi:hypothetical protein
MPRANAGIFPHVITYQVQGRNRTPVRPACYNVGVVVLFDKEHAMTTIKPTLKGLLAVILTIALAVCAIHYLPSSSGPAKAAEATSSKFKVVQVPTYHPAQSPVYKTVQVPHTAEEVTSYTVHVPAATVPITVYGYRLNGRSINGSDGVSAVPLSVCEKYKQRMEETNNGKVLDFVTPDELELIQSTLYAHAGNQPLSGLPDINGDIIPTLTHTLRPAYDTAISADDYEALSAYHAANPFYNGPGTAYPNALAAYDKITAAGPASAEAYPPSLCDTTYSTAVTFTPNPPELVTTYTEEQVLVSPAQPAYTTYTTEYLPLAPAFTLTTAKATLAGKGSAAQVASTVDGLDLAYQVSYDPQGPAPRTAKTPKAPGKYTVYVKTPRQTIAGTTYAASGPLKLGIYTVVPCKASKVSKLKAGKARLTVSWTRQSASLNTTGYQVAYKVKGSAKWHYKAVKGAKAATATLKVAKHKRYTVKVRVYKALPGYTLYSAWTPEKTSPKAK